MKNKRVFIGLMFVVNSLLSILGISFSYLYGASKSSTIAYAALMSLDAKVKSQENTNFLHGSLSYNPPLGSVAESEYNQFLNLQRKTKSNYSYYNSFLVSSNEEGYINYNVDYGATNDVYGEAHLLQVSTFYDFNFMESLGLPLFRFDDGPIRINAKNGANFGAYISASKAEEIANNDSRFAECESLEEAFRKLLTDNTFTFSASSYEYQNNESITFSVNGIYLDNDHSYMFNDFQKKVQTRMYGDYSQSFEFWFKDPIITFAYDIFSKGSTYVFDIRKNYGNLDRFFNYVIGYDYASNDLNISLFDEAGLLYEETDILNTMSREYDDDGKIVFLVLSVISFLALLLSFQFFNKKMTSVIKISYILTPFAIFCLGQIIFNLLIVFKIERYILYQIFNSIGNLIFLIVFFVSIFNAYVWSNYVKKIKN